MGQGLFPAQGAFWMAAPAQSVPFPDLGGLLHSRVRVWVPLPQVAEQAEKALHWPQLPFTLTTRKNDGFLRFSTWLLWLLLACYILLYKLQQLPISIQYEYYRVSELRASTSKPNWELQFLAPTLVEDHWSIRRKKLGYLRCKLELNKLLGNLEVHQDIGPRDSGFKAHIAARSWMNHCCKVQGCRRPRWWHCFRRESSRSRFRTWAGCCSDARDAWCLHRSWPSRRWSRSRGPSFRLKCVTQQIWTHDFELVELALLPLNRVHDLSITKWLSALEFVAQAPFKLSSWKDHVKKSHHFCEAWAENIFSE